MTRQRTEKRRHRNVHALRQADYLLNYKTGSRGEVMVRTEPRCTFPKGHSFLLTCQKIIYLFSFGCIGSPSLCGLVWSCSERGPPRGCDAPASHTLASLVEHRLWGTRASVLAACELGFQAPGSVISCAMARGIVPHQGSTLSLLPWQADSLWLSHQGSPQPAFTIKHNRFHIWQLRNVLALNPHGKPSYCPDLLTI